MAVPMAQSVQFPEVSRHVPLTVFLQELPISMVVQNTFLTPKLVVDQPVRSSRSLPRNWKPCNWKLTGNGLKDSTIDEITNSSAGYCSDCTDYGEDSFIDENTNTSAGYSICADYGDDSDIDEITNSPNTSAGYSFCTDYGDDSDIDEITNSPAGYCPPQQFAHDPHGQQQQGMYGQQQMMQMPHMQYLQNQTGLPMHSSAMQQSYLGVPPVVPFVGSSLQPMVVELTPPEERAKPPRRTAGQKAKRKIKREQPLTMMDKIESLLSEADRHVLSVTELFADAFIRERLMKSKKNIAVEDAQKKLLKLIEHDDSGRFKARPRSPNDNV